MHEFGVDLMSPGGWLPLAFALVMALSMLAYVILDGYDLGVGALLDSADSVEQKDIMIASIGPFWDANETWLVLGVGVLLGGSEGVGGGGYFHGVAGRTGFPTLIKKREKDCKRNIRKTFLPGVSAPQNRQAIPSFPSSSLGTHLSAWSVLRAPGRWRPAGSSASKTSAGPS